MRLAVFKILLLSLIIISCSRHDPFYLPEYEYIDYEGYITFDSIDYEYKHPSTSRLDTLIFCRYILTDTSNLENYLVYDMDTNIVLKVFPDSIFNPWNYVSIGSKLMAIKSILHYVQYRIPEPFLYKILLFDSAGVNNNYKVYHKNTFISKY
jgi:hypothetical protein